MLEIVNKFRRVYLILQVYQIIIFVIKRVNCLKIIKKNRKKTKCSIKRCTFLDIGIINSLYQKLQELVQRYRERFSWR